MLHSEKIDLLVTALSKAQAVMGGAKKDSSNPFFKSKYANLESVWDAAREPLATNGLAVSQLMDVLENGTMVLITMLCHISGQWMRSTALVSPHKPGPQELGSCITYMRRYALAAILSIYQEDDDAETGQKAYRGNSSMPSIPVINKITVKPAQLTAPEFTGEEVAASDDEINELYELLDGNAEREIKMCKHYGVNSINSLSSQQCEAAKSNLLKGAKK